MASHGLTSDHINYLIWRYLQEAGFPDSALKLQQFWMREPQSLPFAPHVDRRALIGLVQKGLKYSQIEQSFKSKSSSDNNASPVATYFGSARGRQPIDDQLIQNGTQPHHLNGRIQHHERFRASPGAGSKPAYPTNGLDVDHLTDEQPGPVFTKQEPQDSGSPTETDNDRPMSMVDIQPEPEFAPVTTLAEGQSIATQSQPVEDLVSRATVFPIADRDALMHATWNPRNHTIALGGNSLCRIQRAIPAEPIDMVRLSDGSLVTSLAWNPDGTMLATAISPDGSSPSSTLTLWTESGNALQELTSSGEMVIKLQWSRDGTMLVGIGDSGSDRSSLLSWNVQQLTAFTPIRCDKVILDATWSDSESVTVCGRGTIGRWNVAGGGGVSWAPKHPHLLDKDWTHVFCNFPDGAVRVYAEEKADVAVLNATGALETISQIHHDSITCISRVNDSDPLLATSSLDGTVKIWRESAIEPTSTLDFGQDSPPLAIALNTHAPLIAAANHARLLVWDLNGTHVPVAQYSGDAKNPKGILTNGHTADKDSGIGDDATEDGMNEPAVALAWGQEGTKLAFGSGNQIAIIDMLP